MRKLYSLFFIVLFLTACGQTDPSENTNEFTEKETTETEQTNEQTSESNSGTDFSQDPFFEPFNGSIDHVHGIGYVRNQNAIFFATHDGLKVFENGKWYRTKKENNDYMGFNAVEKGFFTSGHPGADSSLPNPLGITHSADNGQTLENLDFLGETDFHLMGVGYEKNTIFVASPNNNSKMQAGVFYISEDLGKNWKEVEAKNLDQNINSVAVHPTRPENIAASGDNGIYLSVDKGESFELISSGLQGTSVFFNQDFLWYGGYNGNPVLIKRSLTDGKEQSVSLPDMKQDAVMYLAQNPQDEHEIVFVSIKGDIFKTVDGGVNWSNLVKNGKIQ